MAPAQRRKLKMFNNLIESQSHMKELKRRSRFVLFTLAAYTLLLFGAGVASIYAYDAQLESQSMDVSVISWVPPVVTPAATHPPENQPARRAFTPTARVDPNITTPIRTSQAVSRIDQPTNNVPPVSTFGSDLPPVSGRYTIGTRNADPPSTGGNPNGCTDCRGEGKDPVKVVADTPPPAEIVRVKPPETHNVSTGVLKAHAISLPQPPYPPLARQIKAQGIVGVQILVDEAGRVVSAHAVSGNPFLIKSAEEAALKAKFSPTLLSGQPVKVQGLITYNFVLQ
jgi:protein TonB